MVDFPPHDDVCGAIEEHVRRFFTGRKITPFPWTAGPLADINPHFHVLRSAPREPNGLWDYVTVGGWAATSGGDTGLEFVLSTPTDDPRAIELLALVVFYHHDNRLTLGDTCAIGQPWLPGSTCDHLLISLPYQHGPDLQVCHVGDRHIDLLWLLPITRAERDLRTTHGLEALEQRFDEAGLQYWDIHRASLA